MAKLDKNKIKTEVLRVLFEVLRAGEESLFAPGEESFFAPQELRDLTAELNDLTDQLLGADTTGEKEITAAKIISKKDDFDAAMEALHSYISNLPDDSGFSQARAPERKETNNERFPSGPVASSEEKRGYQLKSWMESKNLKRTIKDMVLQEVYIILNGVDPEDRFLKENEPVDVVQDRHEFAATAAEEAATINQQVNAQGPDQYGMVMALSTDQADWDKHGIKTGEDLAKSMLMSTYSDLYKEFHGFRPRGGVSSDMSVEEINQAVADLEEYIDSYYEGTRQEEPPSVDPTSGYSMEDEESEEPEEPHDKYSGMPSKVGMGRRGE